MSTNANIETSYLRAIGEIRSSGILSGAYVDEIAKGFNDYASKRGFASFFIPQPDGYAPLGLQNLTLTDQNIEFFAFALNQVDTSFGTNNDPLDRALNPDGDDYYNSNVRIGIINLVNDAIATAPASPMGGAGTSPLNYKFPVAGAFNAFFKNAARIDIGKGYIFSVETITTPGLTQINPSFAKQRGFIIYKKAAGSFALISNIKVNDMPMIGEAREQYASSALQAVENMPAAAGNMRNPSTRKVMLGMTDHTGVHVQTILDGRDSSFASIIPIGKDMNSGQLQYAIVGQRFENRDGDFQNGSMGKPLDGDTKQTLEALRYFMIEESQTPAAAAQSVIDAGNDNGLARELISKRDIGGVQTTLMESSGLGASLTQEVNRRRASLARIPVENRDAMQTFTPIIGGGIFTAEELADSFPNISATREALGNGDTQVVARGTLSARELASFSQSRDLGKIRQQTGVDGALKSRVASKTKGMIGVKDPGFNQGYMDFMQSPSFNEIVERAGENMPENVRKLIAEDNR